VTSARQLQGLIPCPLNGYGNERTLFDGHYWSDMIGLDRTLKRHYRRLILRGFSIPE